MLATVMRKDRVAPSTRRSEASKPGTKAPARKQSFSSALGRKEKINVVSKASLAMLNPRLAMGMDSDDTFGSPDTRGSREWSAAMASLKNANRPVWNDEGARMSAAKWTASPTPELEAFTMEDIAMASSASMSAQLTSPPKPPALWVSTQISDEPQALEAQEVSSPIRAPERQERKLSTKRSTGTLSRLFSWKKGGKGGKMPWNELEPMPGLPMSRSASELAMPRSAPPTVTTFDLSGGPFQTSRSDTWGMASSMYAESTSLPCSPVKDEPGYELPAGLQNESSRNASPVQSTRVKSTYRLSRMQSLPSIRIHDITMPTTEEAPAMPTLDKLKMTSSVTSPALPSSPAWESTFGNLLTDGGTPTMRPTSRCVSSTGRGVPSFSPSKFKDAFSPQLRGSTFASPVSSKAERRRSRSLGTANAPPRLSRFGSPPTVFSPASPNMGVFLPDTGEIASPELSELNTFAAQHSFASFSQNDQIQMCPPVANRSPLARENSTSTASSSCRSSFEEQDAVVVVVRASQARREDLTQRARAVPIASPSLSGRSPFNTSPSQFVVTVMPPTPDLAAEATPRMGDAAEAGGFEVNPSWVDNQEILIEEQASSRRTSRLSMNDGSNARIKARRDTVVINSTYAMPQYGDLNGLQSQITPTMSFDYFDASALQQDKIDKFDGVDYTGLQRERRTSEYSDFTELSDISSSSSVGAGPFAFAHSLSQSTLRRSPSSSTLGSESPRSSMQQKFELPSPTSSYDADQMARRYKFASRGPLDFNLPSSSSASRLEVDDFSDAEDSELGYMAAKSPAAPTLENDEAFQADATFAGMYVNANRLSVMSTTAELSLSPHLELGSNLDFGFQLPPTGLPRSKSVNNEMGGSALRSGLAMWEAGSSSSLGGDGHHAGPAGGAFLRSASVGNLAAQHQQNVAMLPPRSMSSDHGVPLARAMFQAGPRPGYQYGHPSMTSKPEGMRQYGSAEADLPEDLHTLALSNGHGFGIDMPLVQARPSIETQRPVIVTPGGLNRVKSSKVVAGSIGMSSGTYGRDVEPMPSSFRSYGMQNHYNQQPQQRQRNQSAGRKTRLPRWRQDSNGSDHGYVMAL
ncbi:unnamed protein product [Tilletia controversa]|uniref:Uncharacterized protein n=4 Tax=Tilletia TaxID=13289 RepID=A0A8X7MXV6_9BASI|nr:hypothetical protein CF336_g1709 [Tilletia laevis]KAE8203433.1 hypothetical protein CF328_g1657 [Tilletia controversa]CAD6885964.1 unnamed protein product [Tilletia caries]KAE8253052.1 hypothetical protein A4X06_0g1731 [Tilletia controversa]CAD6895922.1 unnamed protein product [Tilletia controversa]